MLTTSHTLLNYSESYVLPAAALLLPLAAAAPDAQPRSTKLLWVPSHPVLPLPRPPPADAADPPTACSTRESTLGLASRPLSPARGVACKARTCASICCVCISHSISPSSADEPLPPSRGIISYAHLRAHLLDALHSLPKRMRARSRWSSRASPASLCAPPQSPAVSAAAASIAAAVHDEKSAQACLQASTLKSLAWICTRRACTRSICMLPIPTPGRAAHRSRCTCWKTSCALSRQLAAKSAQSCLTRQHTAHLAFSCLVPSSAKSDAIKDASTTSHTTEWPMLSTKISYTNLVRRHPIW